MPSHTMLDSITRRDFPYAAIYRAVAIVQAAGKSHSRPPES